MFKMGSSARTRTHRRLTSRRQLRPTPYPIQSYSSNVPSQKNSNSSEKKDWEDATCSVCMESPHSAVLLLCSSHDKGCKPYMCGTSYRHSNCLDRFKKAHSKVLSVVSDSMGNNRTIVKLACPLCRGQVKAWTVVSAARQYLNDKRRSCVQDDCSFMGTYRELHKHVKSEHPLAKPRELDPILEQKWRDMELERERQDVISTIRSSVRRSIVFGDYVVEMDSDIDTDDEYVGHGRELDGSSHGVDRGILYFFLRQGAHLMSGPVDDTNSGIAASSSDADEAATVVNQATGTCLRSQSRRRRRRRSRVSDIIS